MVPTTGYPPLYLPGTHDSQHEPVTQGSLERHGYHGNPGESWVPENYRFPEGTPWITGSCGNHGVHTVSGSSVTCTQVICSLCPGRLPGTINGNQIPEIRGKHDILTSL